ncbi:MAG: hypothetical protein NTU84_11695, partial [Verrucomicrobia bacterium]|nr:hypothetical protein [Verrucomicrobiota bacterium]
MPNPKKNERNRPLQSRSHSQKSEPIKSPRPSAAAANPTKPTKRSGTFQKSTGEPSQKLRASILRQISQRPLDAAGIASALDLPPAWKGKLLQLLKEMETTGEIARIRRDRFIIPKEADLFTGILQMHANGGAHVLNEKQGDPDLYIRFENCFTAMHGDRVVARISSQPEEPGFFTRAEKRREGKVIRILTRANETIVGTLQRSKNFFYVVADDPRFAQNLYVKPPAPPLLAKVGDKVVAKLDSWPSRHVNPEGHLVE